MLLSCCPEGWKSDDVVFEAMRLSKEATACIEGVRFKYQQSEALLMGGIYDFLPQT
jgi:hypothetical protein